MFCRPADKSNATLSQLLMLELLLPAFDVRVCVCHSALLIKCVSVDLISMEVAGGG